MAIPDFQSLMLPLLRCLKDGKEHAMSELRNELSNQFDLTQEERNAKLPSGVSKVIDNRVAWAKAHLKMAQLIESTRRGYTKLSPSGLKFLNNHSTELNLRVLKTIPEYIEASKGWTVKKEEEKKREPEDQTPEEILESSYQNIRGTLAQEMLTKVKSCSPQFFEQLVIDLLVKMGYGGTLRDARAIGKSGDGGIDGIIKEDKLGLDVIYVQAKRWENVVGRPELQKFVGALAGQGAKKGIFITTSDFTSDALNYQPKNETKIVLIDGEQLAEYMMDYDVGVSKDRSYDIKKIDYDYFEEE